MDARKKDVAFCNKARVQRKLIRRLLADGVRREQALEVATG